MKFAILLICIFFVSIPGIGQDTLYVSSKFEFQKRLQLYKDSLTAYTTGYDVCKNLSKLFRKVTNGDLSYDSYFLGAWNRDVKPGEQVDTSLSSSEYQLTSLFPNILEGKQFSARGEEQISKEYFRLDTLKVKPCGVVIGSEMPTIYIYKKPQYVIVYKAPCFSVDKKPIYSISDKVTYFLTDDKGKTTTPYNIIYYYGIKGTLIRTEWVDPITNAILKKIE